MILPVIGFAKEVQKVGIQKLLIIIVSQMCSLVVKLDSSNRARYQKSTYYLLQ